MSKQATKEVAILPSDRPFVLMWSEQVSIESLSNTSRVISGPIEGTSEGLKRIRETSRKR